MPAPFHRFGLLALSLAALHPSGVLKGQGSPLWADCKTDSLSTYNCARYYTGTVSLTSQLKTSSGTENRSVLATVTAGRVVCRVTEADGSAFEGPGMLVAEHGSNMTSGAYVVQVWCPEEKGQRVKRADSPILDTYQQQASDYATLAGKDTHEHPDADEANGVSGTETLAWQLHR
jgi:hypothetical protein